LDLYSNDPLFSNQWGLTKIWGPQAWLLVTGIDPLMTAIVGAGVDAGHPDLAGKVLAGYHFVKNSERAADDNGHGTRVAGIAAATSNNGQGMASVTWQARYCRSASWPRWLRHLCRHSGRRGLGGRPGCSGAPSEPVGHSYSATLEAESRHDPPFPLDQQQMGFRDSQLSPCSSCHTSSSPTGTCKVRQSW
jgi:Subtilase family